MKWQFWRKKPQQPDVSGLAFISMERRLLALEQAMEVQRAMLDERTRVMADAISTEFRGVGRIMASLAHTMTACTSSHSLHEAQAAQLACRIRVACW